MGIAPNQNPVFVIHLYLHMPQGPAHRAFSLGSGHVQRHHRATFRQTVALVQRQPNRPSTGQQVRRYPAAADRQEAKRIRCQQSLLAGIDQRHRQLRHQNHGMGLMPVQAGHQLAEIEATAAGHAQGLQRGNRHRGAHQQGQVNPGNVLQQGCQRQNAQVSLQLHTFQPLLQRTGGRRQLLRRQAHALGGTSTAGGEGNLGGVFRHPGGSRGHRQMSQPDAMTDHLRLFCFATEYQGIQPGPLNQVLGLASGKKHRHRYTHHVRHQTSQVRNHPGRGVVATQAYAFHAQAPQLLGHQLRRPP